MDNDSCEVFMLLITKGKLVERDDDPEDATYQEPIMFSHSKTSIGKNVPISIK